MRILFSLRHPLGTRNFEPVLRHLADQGHSIHLSYLSDDKGVGSSLVRQLAAEKEQISYGSLPARKHDPWSPAARRLRFVMDALRYRLPMYDAAVKLRTRALRRLTPSEDRFVRRSLWRSTLLNGLVCRLLARADAALPAAQVVLAEVRERCPDLILVSPLVDFGSEQVEYVKAGRQLSVRVALAVNSWDNLTNKGLIRQAPDAVFVWNATQRDEAVRYHGIPSRHVHVTGAPTYDRWFGRTPSRSAEEFKKERGLDVTKPYVLYMCSSPFIAEREAEFVVRWAHALRASDRPALRNAGILIRPHPENRQPWQRVAADLPVGTVVWPAYSSGPVDPEAAADYFDSMYHSSVVVGINSSGLIESGIVGRPVCTLLDQDFRDTQAGTIHFHYLVGVEGGLLHVSRDWTEHEQYLADALQAGPGPGGSLNRRFVESFARPHGLGAPAGPLMADAIVQFCDSWRRPFRLPSVLNPLIRWIVGRGFGSSRRSVGKGVRAPAVHAGGGSGLATAERELARLRSSDADTILLGPWLDGHGLEALYWLPFLGWATPHIGGRRLVAVSSGGVGAWYRDLASQYIEILDYLPEDQFAARNRERQGTEKPLRRHLSPFDREIIRIAKQAVAGRRVRTLFPSLLFDLYRPVWTGEADGRATDSVLAPRRLPPLLDEPAGESAERIALAFAPTTVFPAADLIPELSNAIREALLQQGYVPTGSSPASMSTASMYVGTDPDAALLAAAYGLDAVLLYSDGRALPDARLERAFRVAEALGSGSLETLDVGAGRIVERVSRRAGQRLKHDAV